MIVLLLKIVFRDVFLRMVKYIPLTQGMCNEVVHIEPRSLEFIPNHFKTQEMCDKAVEVDPYTLKFVPVYLRMGEMSVEKYLHPMRDVPDPLKHKKCAIKQSRKIHGS